MRVLTWVALAAVFLGGLASGEAQAPGPVLLLESAGLRPELCAALRIQLTGLATVSCRTDDSPGSLSTRIALASRAVTREHAQLAVLLESDPDPGRVRMILVGAREDRAVLAIESIENRPAPDVDRSLALKVRDTLEVLHASAEPAADKTLSLALVPPAHESAAALGLLLEGGAALSLSAQTRAAGLLGLGARLSRGAKYGELVLEAQSTNSTRERSALGSVTEREWGLALALRAGRVLGRVAIGVLGQVGFVRANGFGVTRDGHTGDQTVSLPRFGLGLDLRVLLLRGPAQVVLRAAPTLLLDSTRQRFTLDQQSALELSRLHAWLPLSLLVELPIRRSGARDDV